jgi:hypothetical protein
MEIYGILQRLLEYVEPIADLLDHIPLMKTTDALPQSLESALREYFTLKQFEL